MPYAPDRELPKLSPRDCTVANARKEFGIVAQKLQDRAQEASQKGNAGDAFTLHTAAGMVTDKWLSLVDAPEQSEQQAKLTCSCHGHTKELEKTRRLLAKWLPKALLAVRQIASSLEEAKTPTRNIYNWASSARISVEKVVTYHARLLDMSPTTASLGAHRAEIILPGGLMDKLAVAADALRASGKKVPAVRFRKHDAAAWRDSDQRLDQRLDLGERE